MRYAKNLLLPHRCKLLGAALLAVAMTAAFPGILPYSDETHKGDMLLRSAAVISLAAIPLVALSREQV